MSFDDTLSSAIQFQRSYADALTCIEQIADKQQTQKYYTKTAAEIEEGLASGQLQADGKATNSFLWAK